jgi:hypothetical protein
MNNETLRVMRGDAAYHLKCLERFGGIVVESRIREAEDFFFANFKVAKLPKFGGKVLKLSMLMRALILAGLVQDVFGRLWPLSGF